MCAPWTLQLHTHTCNTHIYVCALLLELYVEAVQPKPEIRVFSKVKQRSLNYASSGAGFQYSMTYAK